MTTTQPQPKGEKMTTKQTTPRDFVTKQTAYAGKYALRNMETGELIGIQTHYGGRPRLYETHSDARASADCEFSWFCKADVEPVRLVGERGEARCYCGGAMPDEVHHGGQWLAVQFCSAKCKRSYNQKASR